MKKIYFEASTHTYTDEDGNIVKSVTQVLKDVGFGPQGGFSNNAMKVAADRGNKIHDLLNDHVLMGKIKDEDVPAGLIGYYRAFNNFIDDNDVKFECGEYRVFGEICGLPVAGTVDLKGIVNGRRSIIDFKSTKSIEKYHAYQLAMYRALDEEKIEGAFILQLFENGTYVFMEDEVIAPGCNDSVSKIVAAAIAEEKFTDAETIPITPDVLRWVEVKAQIDVLDTEKKKIETRLKSSIKGSSGTNKHITITYTKPSISRKYDEDAFLNAIDDNASFTGLEIKKLIEQFKTIEIGKPTYKIAATKVK